MYNPLKIESLRAELRGEFDYSDLLRDMAVDEILDNDLPEPENLRISRFNPYSYLEQIF